MNVRTTIAALLLFVSFQAAAQEQMSLSGNWHFALAKTGEEAEQLSKFYEEKFDASSFKPIPVPSNWAVLGFEEPVYRGFKEDKASEGFYLYEFKAPLEYKGKRVLLNFGGVWSSAEVWLNGKRLGDHHGGYSSFAFNVSDKIKAGASNQLAVRVRQVNEDYKFDVNDDWTLGGIYRDVTLEAMPQKRWFDHVVFKTEFDKAYQNADLKISTMVNDKNKGTLPGNYPSPGEAYHLRFTLTDKAGKVIAHQDSLIPAHTSTGREILTSFRVNAPLRWTAETPYLYNLQVELFEKGKVTQSYAAPVGFRQISTEGGVFRINGQAVKLRGVNRHDEHPDVGRATNRKIWLQDLTLMKQANINYIRMSHYAPAKGFVQLADSLGMYLGEEVSMGGAGELMYNPSFSPAVLQRSYETVVRDINDPAVVYWSIGNEDPLTPLHLASIKLVKALDPTRPVLIPWRAEEWLPVDIDILAPHYWQPKEYDNLAAHSTRPIISTEYTHAFGVNGFGGLELRWKALTKHPAGAGAAIWMWADQGIKTPVKRLKGKTSDMNGGDDYLRIDEAGWDGIVDSYRNFTRDYWEAKAVYAQVYPATDKISFSNRQATLAIPIQNDFDFTDLNTVKIAWSIFADETELAAGAGSVAGKPHNVSTFNLPLDKIKNIVPGKTYYARFIFTRADGTEITRESIDLVPQDNKSAKTISGNLTVTKGDNVIIEAGETKYTFDTKTGQLISASLKGKTLVTDLRPVIWHKPDRSEMSVIGKADAKDAADLNKFTQSVVSWDVQQGQSAVMINAKVDYVVDSKDQFTTTCNYTITADGKMKVKYQIATKVAVSCVPVVGMAAQFSGDLDRLRWLGLGPYSAYPNKRSAPILGVWGGAANGAEVAGTKAMRWAEQSGSAGIVRVTNDGYLEHDSAKPGSLSILSGVLGRPEKGRKADDSVPQLLTNGEPLTGEFTIELFK
ncbi:hypothetical protein KXQ82_04635 [Mucilaginibacter sp. HMF5004]|uniref:glycoside hydrolase family 2 TIM barrel-domain containing protein n=1 Tax=Mucilaginibacter rivuli TaxID=2857527 RepID=UPI001C5F432D|nr:glycoside hydrolase family 2 TIM barrel-domain containing protein [Mucilaginibacter rivuli]MBW4888985.1 hypothetical protein [Mucilaginibacter rivuli]